MSLLSGLITQCIECLRPKEKVEGWSPSRATGHIKTGNMNRMGKWHWILLVVIIVVLSGILLFTKLAPFWVTISVVVAFLTGVAAVVVFGKWYNDNYE